MADKDKRPYGEGFVPPEGYVTVEWLANEWKCRDARNLERYLVSAAIPIAKIPNGKLVNCDDLKKLFWGDSE